MEQHGYAWLVRWAIPGRSQPPNENYPGRSQGISTNTQALGVYHEFVADFSSHWVRLYCDDVLFHARDMSNDPAFKVFGYPTSILIDVKTATANANGTPNGTDTFYGAAGVDWVATTAGATMEVEYVRYYTQGSSAL